MIDNRILSLLRTPTAILVVLIIALCAQIPHAADVFRLIAGHGGALPSVHSYLFAVALELAVLLFVVQHRHIESYIFAVVSVAMNLSYYHLAGIDLISMLAMPAWLVSVALPVAIARYSHAVAEAQPKQDFADNLRAEFEQYRTEAEQRTAESEQTADNLRRQLDEVQSRLDAEAQRSKQLRKQMDETERRLDDFQPDKILSRMTDTTRAAVMELMDVVRTQRVESPAQFVQVSDWNKSKAYPAWQMAEASGLIWKNGDDSYHAVEAHT